MIIILLEDRISEVMKTIGLILIIPSIVSMYIVKFMNKSLSVGSITFDKDLFAIEVDGFTKEFGYDLIKKLKFTNYDGQQYFSLKDIYPYYDGLNNYIWVDNDNEIKKFEIKIESKYAYQALERHFDSLQENRKNKNWKIK